MRFLATSLLTLGICLGLVGESQAQFSLSVGNPYGGSGLYVGSPGYLGGYPGYGYAGGSGYVNGGGYAAPGTFAYSSGYLGVAPVAPLGYGYANRGYYGGYGYRNYGYGYRNGFGPFRGGRRFYR